VSRATGRHTTPNSETLVDQAAALLPAVAELARLAGDIALGYFDQARRSRLPVERKADGSPVTVADRNAEAAARDWVDRRFPGDGFLGEETGATRAGVRRRWIVDPIDGTKSFVRGVPLWGTLVAIADGDTVLAGAINCAAAGELVAAALGQGCWWNGSRCSVSVEHQLARATVLATDERFPQVSVEPGTSDGDAERERERRWSGWRRVAERAAVARSWGDGYGYLLVATGRAEAMFDAIMAPWDSAALWPVVTEAGGVFTDWNGAVTAFGGSGVATNAALAVEVRGLLSAASRT
jgi:histidinol phosphatase-like enzyme (inositol monophosphatase family)